MMEKVIIDSEFEFEKVFDKNDVIAFAQLSQDDNPIHINEEYASGTFFKRNIVHGVLIVSMFSKIFGTIYPGNGCIYLSQSAKFLKPAFVCDSVKAKVKLVSFDETKKRGVFLCECYNQAGQLLVTGEAVILFPDTFTLYDAKNN